MQADDYIKYLLTLGAFKVQPLYGKMRYRIGTKVVLTHNILAQRFCILISPEQQETLHNTNPEYLHPVPNKYGLLGYTLVYYQHLDEQVVKQLIYDAYIYATTKVAKTKSVNTTKKHIDSVSRFTKSILAHKKDAFVVYQEINNNAVQRCISSTTNGDSIINDARFTKQVISNNTTVEIDAELFERLWQLWG